MCLSQFSPNNLSSVFWWNSIVSVFGNRKEIYYSAIYTASNKLREVKYVSPLRPSFSQSVSASVCQQVSPVFLVNSTPLKSPHGISLNFACIQETICRCARYQITMKFRIHFLLLIRNFVVVKDKGITVLILWKFCFDALLKLMYLLIYSLYSM